MNKTEAILLYAFAHEDDQWNIGVFTSIETLNKFLGEYVLRWDIKEISLRPVSEGNLEDWYADVKDNCCRYFRIRAEKLPLYSAEKENNK